MEPRTAEWSIRPVHSGAAEDFQIVADLHMELLWFGPMAGLGNRFIREVCYRMLADSGMFDIALLEILGEPAGFVAYTPSPGEFHRSGFRKHWFRAGMEFTLAALSHLHKPRAVWRAVREVTARRSETETESGNFGEVVCVAVKRKFLTGKETRRLGTSPSVELVRYALTRMHASGASSVRMLVDPENKPALFMYHRLGASMKEYADLGEPRIQVWFDLEDGNSRERLGI